jgi:hypothetical protein
MNRSGVFLTAAFVAMSAAGWAFVAPPIELEATAAQAGPEHARLAAMTGTWDVQMTLWPRPGSTGLRVTATSVIRPLFGGLFVEEKIEGTLNGAPFATMAWTGFNTGSRQYEATRIASSNPARIIETGAYDEAARQFELKGEYVSGGQNWRQRTVIQPTGDESMVATSYLSFGAVAEWKAVEIKYTRRAK